MMVITRDKGSSRKRKQEEHDKETKAVKSQKTESNKSYSSVKKGKSLLQPTSEGKANSSKDAKVKAKEAKLHKTEVSEVDKKAKPKRNEKNSKSSELKSKKKSINKSSHAEPIFFKENIIGSDSGWQPVPLTELITSTAVKKAYRKATLCVHLDKLQQRRATIQQIYIYIYEKVFDLLKDAWECYSKL